MVVLLKNNVYSIITSILRGERSFCFAAGLVVFNAAFVGCVRDGPLKRMSIIYDRLYSTSCVLYLLWREHLSRANGHLDFHPRTHGDGFIFVERAQNEGLIFDKVGVLQPKWPKWRYRLSATLES